MALCIRSKQALCHHLGYLPSPLDGTYITLKYSLRLSTKLRLHHAGPSNCINGLNRVTGPLSPVVCLAQSLDMLRSIYFHVTYGKKAIVHACVSPSEFDF